MKLNFAIDKKLLDFDVLNKGDKKILEHPCNFFILISLMLCAEPRISNFFGSEYLDTKLI